MIQNILRNCGYWCFIQPPKDWLEAAVADAASQHPRLGILSRKSINIKHYSMLQSTWARRTQQSHGYALSSPTHSIIKTKLLLLNLLHWKNIHVNNQGHQHFSFFIFIRLTFYSIPVNKASYQLKQKKYPDVHIAGAGLIRELNWLGTKKKATLMMKTLASVIILGLHDSNIIVV